MPARQQHLFPPGKPLVERLGKDFFAAVPRCPGVYIMTGAYDRVLYVGQSKNLRVRLATYKNARPDRDRRKIIRLVHQVDRIAWEKCESAQAARLRENELLRLHRPKFNRVNTYPAAYWYLWFSQNNSGLELGRGHEPRPGANAYGAFKGGALGGFAALLRLLWACWNRPNSVHEFPAGLLSSRPPALYPLNYSGPGAENPSVWVGALHQFLQGISSQLISLLADSLPLVEGPGQFLRELLATELEILEQFYHLGPRRNSALRRDDQLSGRLIPYEELDDLIELAKDQAPNPKPRQVNLE